MSDLGPLVPKPAVVGSGSTPVTSTSTPNTSAPGGSASAPPPQAPSSPTAILQGDAAEIAASARELAKGGQIAAQVVARDAAALLVRTAAGNTLALTNLAQAFEQANLATLNAAIRLQLNPANPQQATVLSVNGTALPLPMPAQAMPPTAAQLALAASPPQPASAAATPVLPQAGQSLQAVLVTPATNSAGAALPAGSQLQLTVQTVTLPNAGGAVSTPALPGQPAAIPGAAVATPASVAPQVTASPAGATPAQAVSIRPAVSASAPPATPAAPSVQTPVPAPTLASAAAAGLPQSSVPPPAQTLVAQSAAVAGAPITAIVTGQGQGGQVMVSTPQGVLALNLPQPLPPGTQLVLELGSITRPPAMTPTQLTPAPLAGVLTRLQDGWPNLQATLDAVRAADPALAQRLQTELLPQPNARLASTALQFIAAAAAGNAQAWLGSEAVRKLEQSGRGDLLRKLDDDFRDLGRLNQRQGDNDWQALVMPMMIGGKVEPIQIFMRRRKDPKKQQKQTRFLIDFNLESTGPIQFDGFVGTKQLDLILRTESAFGPAFRLDVTAIFEEALAITGMVGSLRFHDREKPLPWPSPELDSRGPSTEIKA